MSDCRMWNNRMLGERGIRKDTKITCRNLNEWSKQMPRRNSVTVKDGGIRIARGQIVNIYVSSAELVLKHWQLSYTENKEIRKLKGPLYNFEILFIIFYIKGSRVMFFGQTVRVETRTRTLQAVQPVWCYTAEMKECQKNTTATLS
jgi:hypothetical protein